MPNSNVLYYEPNYNYHMPNKDGVNIFNIVQTAPPLEDYCVIVDLEVEIPARPLYGEVKANDSVIRLRYMSSMNGNSRVSFNQGKKYPSSDSYYLTTEPFDKGTFNDIKFDEISSSEMFGINSINIEYKTYAVPIITIEFTDIRGLSLFAHEDLRHNIVGTDGVAYSANDDIAGSFFKCFFIAPRPRFRIMVKGFYGNPVSYELVCSDFRASFNSSTGNFGATAKFVGFTFSLLNDLTMASLIASPYSEYFGKKYWQNNANKFVFDDGKPMIPLYDVMKKVEVINSNLQKEDTTEEKSEEEKINKISQISHSHSQYFTKLITIIKETTNESNYIIDEKNFRVVTYGIANNLKSKLAELDTLYNTFVNISTNNGYEKYIPNKYSIDNKITINELRQKNFYGEKNLSAKKFNQIKKTDEYYLIFYDGFDFQNTILNSQQAHKNNILKIQHEKDNAKNQRIEQILGFKPSVKNITELILAHVETLIHEIYTCASNVKKISRNADMKYHNDMRSSSDEYYAFPLVTIETDGKNNQAKKEERTWIGRYDSSSPEAQLVESLLQATTTTTKTLKVDGQEFITNEQGFNLNLKVPVLPFDFIGNSTPYYNVNVNDYDDFCGKILIRALLANSSIVNEKKTTQVLTEIGYGDALNFYHNNQGLSSSFRDKLFTSNIITTDNIMNLYLDQQRNSILSNRKKPIWYTSNYQKNNLLESNGNNSEYQCLFFSNSNKKYDILPIGAFKWESFPIELNYASSKYFDQTLFYTYGVGKSNDNIFKIETQWENYQKYNNEIYQSKLQNVNDIYELQINSKSLKSWYTSMLDKASMLTRKSNLVYNNITLNHNDFPLILPFNAPNLTLNQNIGLEKSNENSLSYKNTKSKEYNISSIDNEQLIDIFDNFNNFNNYTINYFCGYNDNTISNVVSLFGQSRYYTVYNQNGIKAAALMFLHTFGWNYNTLEYLLKQGNFNYIPYLAVAAIGGYYYKFDNEKEFHNCSELNSFNFYENFSKIKKEIKEAFKSFFINWVDTTFVKIHSNFALHLKSGSSYQNMNEFFNKFVQKYRVCNENTSVEHAILELRNNLTDDFFTNYSMVQLNVSTNDYGFKLINRENSEMLNEITKQLFMPCLLISSCKNPFVSSSLKDQASVINLKGIDSYIKGFIKGLKENYPETENTETNTLITTKTVDQVKIALYNYLKIIWDKWLSGTPLIGGKSPWDLMELKNNWHYIDSFYNKLTDQALINIIDFAKDLGDAFKSMGVSALSVMSSSYARSRFNLMCVQNFADLVDDKLMKDMFKTIPYNEIDSSMIKTVSDFVVIYLNEPSSKLDIQSSRFSDDSFLIGGDNMQLPIPILTKKKDDYKIPAFGVTYGGQYQSYFSDIQVNMENPQVTDQSLQAEFAIVKGNDNNNVNVIGQDLFTIYANQSFTCTVTMLGCAWVQPLMYFQLNNIPMFKGSYLIQNVTHSITPGNMVTKFTGTRMSKNSTPFVDNGIMFNFDIQQMNYDSSNNIDQSKKADIYNNCPYKYFSPLKETVTNGMSEDELNMTVSEYGKHHGGWLFKLPSDKLSKTMANFFADIAYGETSHADDLSVQLILTVLFNRYKACNNNLCKVLKNAVQHEVNKTCPDSIKDKYISLAKKIFMQTPLYLVGEQTYVKKRVPIWNFGTNTKSYSISKTLTPHDVKSIDSYCSTKGYDTNYKNPRDVYNTDKEPLEAIPPSSKAYWHKGEYIAQHDITKNDRFGHVFTSVGFENKKPGTEHWQPVIKKESLNNDKQLSLNLFNSIKQTIDYSDNISIKGLKMEFVNNQNNVFRITSDTSQDLAQIFDIVNNTYYDHFAELHWVVQNSGNDLPKYVQIKVSNGSRNKIIAVSQEQSNNQIKILPQYDNLNDLFYLSLQKRYGDLNATKQQFKLECLNFLSVTKNENWESNVRKYFNATLQDCIIFNNDSFSLLDTEIQGFSWKGRNVNQNTLKPISIKPQDPSFIDKAVDYIVGKAYDVYNKELCGHCARAVREGLMHKDGGNLPLKNYPFSACCYVNHLPYWGFKKVYMGEANTPIDGYTPKNGDIAVIAGYGSQKDGHIQIYSSKTNMWYSDYKEKDIWCYNSPKGRPYIVFRYIPQ